jgi:CheY-like chemotaxis protein/nitrogen-specific signal transduction histidine kinase
MLALRYRMKDRMLKMERAVIEANARSEAKSDFLSTMSHEIRTPLNAVMGLSLSARHCAGDEDKVKECLDKLDKASEYLLSLINDILDMALIESGKMTLTDSSFSLTELTENIEYIYRPIMEEKQHKFEISTDICNDRVRADKSKLKQVIFNLLSNAAKYTPQGGHIRLEIREITGEPEDLKHVYYFAVHDNGIGISDEDKNRVLMPFEQVRDRHHSTGLQGTGLGLAISRQILNLMGSDIRLNSEQGKGSSFWFEVKFEEGEAKEEQENFICSGKNSIEGTHIIIADDNEMNARMLADLLEAEGVTSTVCLNGREAVDAFLNTENFRIDAILMDIQMPVMDGLEAAAAIRRSSHPDAEAVPIIAVTAFAFGRDVEASIKAGMNAHVSKPIHMGKLCSLMASLIKKEE